MGTLFGFVVVILLLAAGVSVLTGFLGGRSGRGQPRAIALRVARVVLLATLMLMLLPLLLLLVAGVWLLTPKGRIWSNYWGHTLAEGTKAVWHWIFGPPKVRIHRQPRRNAVNRRQRFQYWRN
jgi:hypothetical protein